MRHCVVFCSPNGSTERVARVIAQRLLELDSPPHVFDLGLAVEREEALSICTGEGSPLCLWIGSPVYVDHMVPPVEDFLRCLPGRGDSYAVPFVTWGAVNSGVALYEMGQILEEKGYLLLGAAKVLSVHSSFWRSQHPLGAGHPDGEDDAGVRGLVDAVQEKLSSRKFQPLALQALDYQPVEVKEAARSKSIAAAKKLYPELAVDRDRCTQCGECAAICPAGAIVLDPYPRFREHCFICLKCVRECPEDAIPRDMAAVEERIRGMAKASKEPPLTEIFV